VIAELVRPARLNGAVRTTADWLGCYLDARAVNAAPGPFARFWFSEVDAAAVPHQWLSLTAQRYQLKAKIRSSRPYDAQHCAYLPEADLFVSADRRLVRTVADMARDAPLSFARGPGFRYG
jgi:hypothetical protein